MYVESGFNSNLISLYRFFEQMSSVKTRKHYVIADMGFSALWAFFYAVAFLVMSVAWSKTSGKYSYSKANILGAIFFCFCSILTWVGNESRDRRMCLTM